MSKLITPLLCAIAVLATIQAHAQTPFVDRGIDPKKTNSGVPIYPNNYYVPFSMPDRAYYFPPSYRLGRYVTPHKLTTQPQILANSKIKAVYVYMFYATSEFPGDRDSSLVATFRINRNGDLTHSYNGENYNISRIYTTYHYKSPHRIEKVKESRNKQIFITFDYYTYYNNNQEVFKSHRLVYSFDSTDIANVSKIEYDSLGRPIILYDQVSSSSNLQHIIQRNYYDPQNNRLIKEDHYSRYDNYDGSTVYEYDSTGLQKTTWLQTNADTKVKTQDDYFDHNGDCIKTILYGAPDKMIINTYNPDRTLYQTEVYVQEDRKELTRYYYAKY